MTKNEGQTVLFGRIGVKHFNNAIKQNCSQDVALCR